MTKQKKGCTLSKPAIIKSVIRDDGEWIFLLIEDKGKISPYIFIHLNIYCSEKPAPMVFDRRKDALKYFELYTRRKRLIR